MKLLFIYGPPAVGKLTVAKELEKLTHFKLFHNHLTLDVVTSFFDHGTESYFKMVRKIRFAMFEEAMQTKISGVITTIVYGPARLDMALDYAHFMRERGGEIYPVRLYCEREVLDERVVQEERKAFGKLADVTQLEETMVKLDAPFAEIDGLDSLSLDVGKLTAGEAAEAIVKHYRLL